MPDDFFDDDLIDETSPDDQPQADPPPEPLSETSLRRMKRQKQELTTQVVGAVKEIEELRRRQELLEKERSDIEDLARKQDAYEAAKRDIMDKLSHSIIHLEKDETQATRFVELLSVMRNRFRDTLAELEGISEAGWSNETFQVELNKALVLVEDARAVYGKGMAKIEAETWQKVKEGQIEPLVLRKGDRPGDMPRSFGFWLRAGLAFAVPLLVSAVIIFAIAVILRLNGWW